MAVGRISGPLLKQNLLRDGVDLAFETDLLYLDVINGRVGIKTTAPSNELQVVGTTRSTNLEVQTQADIATFSIAGNTISSTNGTISLEPSGANAVVYQAKMKTGNLQLSTNLIETLGTNTDLNIQTTGTGEVNINANVLVNGDLHATGTITADGNLTLGDTDTDSIDFNADIASNIIPNTTNFYDLGTDPTLPGGKEWRTVYSKNLIADNINTTNVTISGINLILPQGNIIYVATTGDNANSGEHEHDPFLTIKYALSQAVSGDTIYIYPGTYEEIFPMTVPAGVTIRGAGIRAVTIKPTAGTIDKDAFLLNGETTVEELSITDFRFNGTNNTGYAFRFAPSFTVTSRSPYVRNVTVITKGSTTSPTDPYGYDSDDAGKGVFLDGSVANVLSKEAAMLFHSVTFITPNQETVVATNGVRIEWLNSFTYFADKGIYAYSSASGFAGQGKTRLRINNKVGTWNVGNTVTYYNTDGTTVLASGTIASIDGDYVNLTGRQLGFETITDRAGKTVFANGNAKLSTSQIKFGTASLALDGTGDFANVASQPDFEFGTGDFCIEGWVYPTASGTYRTLFDLRTSAGDTGGIILGLSDIGALYFFYNGNYRVGPVGSVPTNQWTHVALARVSGNTRLFIGGTQVGSTYVDSNSYAARPVRIGADPNGNYAFPGYIDDVRISKGAGRYSSNFSVPTAALSGDLSTVLLLHFNGTNNSTTFLDDGVTYQDVRTSAGGTSNTIDFADYSDFGAEIRSIGSANVYGTYGTYGDGVGVIAYLISQNYAYVGSGKKSTNDPLDRIAANEVVELNNAKIYYTSVDNEGNFSVGDAFYVNQKTGEVLFNGSLATVTALTGITFTDGSNTTVITGNGIDTGNIRVSGNTVESLSGNLNVTAANGEINLQNNTFITGDLDVTGDITLGGNITIGDQTTDTINFVGGISSNLVPSTTNTYDIGTTSARWDNIFLNRAEIDGVVIDANTISTTLSNDDLQLIANGTGRIYVPNNDVQIDQSLTVTNDFTVTTGTSNLKNVGINGTITQTGDINQTGNFTTSGLTSVTGNITGTGYLQLPVIRLDGNVVSTTTANTDLKLFANGTGNVIFESLTVNGNIIEANTPNTDIVLTPQGTGSVYINTNQSLVIPVGTDAERPASPTLGMIRYNTTRSQYEGWNGSYWLPLSGVSDVDGNTKIIAEATPGANDNTLYFYANNSLMATIDSTKMFVERLQTSNLNIQNNTISPILSNSDINLTPTGTGAVRVGNLRIKDNTITNIVSGGITEFAETGTGYVKISGTNGVVIPTGTDAERPGNAIAGMVRFNTTQQLVEVYNGTVWTSVAGTSSGVTFNEAQEIGIGIVLTLG